MVSCFTRVAATLLLACAACGSTSPPPSITRWRPTPNEVVSSCRQGPDSCIAVRQLPAPTCNERDPGPRWTVEASISDEASIERFLELASNDTGIEHCWEAAVRYCWPAAGRVALIAIVAADGRPLSVVVDQMDPDDRTELASCLAGRALRWRLPRSHSERRRLRVSMTFPASAVSRREPREPLAERPVLGCWARPQVIVEGDAAPSRFADWRTNLWLSTDVVHGNYRYSDASTHRSAIGLADVPGAFVELYYVGDAALETTGGTLTVPGHPTLRQTPTRMHGYPAVEIDGQAQTYRYHFPLRSSEWPHLDFRVAFEDSRGALHIRFDRDATRQPRRGSLPFFGCD